MDEGLEILGIWTNEVERWCVQSGCTINRQIILITILGDARLNIAYCKITEVWHFCWHSLKRVQKFSYSHEFHHLFIIDSLGSDTTGYQSWRYDYWESQWSSCTAVSSSSRYVLCAVSSRRLGVGSVRHYGKAWEWFGTFSNKFCDIETEILWTAQQESHVFQNMFTVNYRAFFRQLMTSEALWHFLCKSLVKESALRTASICLNSDILWTNVTAHIWDSKNLRVCDCFMTDRQTELIWPNAAEQ